MLTKNLVKPKLYSIADIYKDYAKGLLAKNPNYVGTCKNGITNYIISRRYRFKTEIVITYKMFSDIISTFHKRVGDRIIAGQRFNLGNNMGYIEARCVERNFSNKVLDYYETKKRKKEILDRGGTIKSKERPDGEEYRILRMDKDYVRIGWVNPNKVKNISLYEFVPATNGANKTSLMNRFSKANKLNSLLRLKYKYYPYIT